MVMVIYGRPQCYNCVVIKDLAESKGIDFEYRNIDEELEIPSWVEDLKADGFRTLPFVKREDGFTFAGLQQEEVK